MISKDITLVVEGADTFEELRRVVEHIDKHTAGHGLKIAMPICYDEKPVLILYERRGTPITRAFNKVRRKRKTALASPKLRG